MNNEIALNRYQFEVLRALAAPSAPTAPADAEVLASSAAQSKKSQRDIAAEASISLGSVNKAYQSLKALGCINEDGSITPRGLEVLAPYKVENAVILAASMDARLAPLSFEKPKGMFEVRGEVLVERLIKQLQAAGIRDIVVVVGYMKEMFFYLEEEFGIRIAVNHDYAVRNDHSSIWSARRVLGNSYVVPSGQYYSQNIFSLYNYESYCSACFSRGATEEQVLILDGKNRVTGLTRGGSNAYFLQGPAYFDRGFSRTYLEFLGREYDRPETAGKQWEQIFAEHADDLPMAMRVVEPGVVFEFDDVTDLIAFDHDFFGNVDSRILDNICQVLDCAREDITEVAPVKAGLTNLSTLFTVKGRRYIYRHPGPGTEKIINRRAEAFALEVARELGLDDTFLFEDPDEGWKISVYAEGCSELDYSNREQVARALQMARTLHTSGKTFPYSFDFYDGGVKIANMLRDMRYPLPRDFDSLASRVAGISAMMRPEAEEPVLCHNDFYGPNFLVRGEKMILIDWEYAAMGDPTCDIGNFVAQGSGYSVEETLDILPLYYGRPATDVEQRHCVAAVGVVGWYWYVWAMYKEAMGNPVGEWLYIWYRAAKEFTAAAERLYGV